MIAADLDGPGAAALAAELGGESWTVDLTSVAALEGLRLDVDILVNNAGIQHVAPVEEFPPAMFRRILQLMVEAPFLLARAALPHMYQQGYGRVINISSVHGLRASPFKSAYVTAKHGLEGLSKVIALEGAARGVTSNCISPGYVRTPLVEKQIADQARVHGIPEDQVLGVGHPGRECGQAAGRAGRGGRAGALAGGSAGRHGHRHDVHARRRLDREVAGRGGRLRHGLRATPARNQNWLGSAGT